MAEFAKFGRWFAFIIWNHIDDYCLFNVDLICWELNRKTVNTFYNHKDILKNYEFSVSEGIINEIYVMCHELFLWKLPALCVFIRFTRRWCINKKASSVFIPRRFWIEVKSKLICSSKYSKTSPVAISGLIDWHIACIMK